MSNLDDEKLDEIIKEKFKNDKIISEKANSVFENFKISENNINKNMNNNTEIINKNMNNNTNNHVNEKVIKVTFYKKLNRILSVSAVTLTVVIVGGTAIYFKNDNSNNDNQNEPSIIYTQKSLVKNETLKFSNEMVLKESENAYVRAYLLGKRDVGIDLTSTYWNEIDGEFKSTECYKVDNVDKDVSDVLVGEISGLGTYVFLLMEDGTIEYVDLFYKANDEIYYVAVELEGLDNVAGFEQKSKNYSYSKSEYKYVNAIRNDGLRKEIEIGVVNDWNDNVIENFNKLNQKYIGAYNKTAIPDDGKGDFTVNNITYLTVNGESKYVYYLKNNKFYRVQRSNAQEECIVSGCGGYMRDNSDGRISLYLNDGYVIYSLDKNIIYRDNNKNIINEVNASTNNNANQNKVDYSIFSDYKGKLFKNAAYNISADGRKEYCELSFDQQGKPTLKIGYKSDVNTECYFQTEEITNIRPDVAAGTTYITIDFKAWTPGGDTTGSATISYGNVIKDYTMTVSAKLNDDSTQTEFKNIEVKLTNPDLQKDELILKDYKNEVYESEKKENEIWYKIEFDANGVPTITVGRYSNRVSAVKEIYNRFSDVIYDAAAGSSYISFNCYNGNGTVSKAQLKCTNVIKGDSIYLKISDINNNEIELKKKN